VFPYRPFLLEKDAGEKELAGRRDQPATNETWALLVDAGQQQAGEPVTVVCDSLIDAGNRYEGLIVLTSSHPREELDEWMSDLREEGVGKQGVLLDRARTMLASRLGESRGVPRGVGATTWTPEEREAIRRAIQKAARQPGYRLGLPGVDEFWVECRVAGR